MLGDVVADCAGDLAEQESTETALKRFAIDVRKVRRNIFLGMTIQRSMSVSENKTDLGSLAVALDLRVDGRKKLNFEWDTDGKYALRGFTRGEWFEDISAWNLVARQKTVEERRVA